MTTSLISPLSIRECISRLEEFERKETVPLSNEFTPPKCKVRGNSFTLRKNNFKYVPFMNGKLSETPEGTLITYSMEINSTTRNFGFIWLAGAIPLASCFVIANILDGLIKGFSWETLLVSLGAISIPTSYYFMRRYGEHYSESDKKEMLEFLQKTLDAKPRMS
jgi:hypothetical protein